jgi:flagellar hook-associated protein 1 FlgK
VPSIYSMMDISRWALLSSTRQLDTVSHNVANVNNADYSRQEVIQATRTPERAREGFYGTGVQLLDVIQNVDKLLFERITDKGSDQSYEEARLTQLQRLEALSNEAGDAGLGYEITAFFNAWQDVANNPESSAVRQVLKETANNLANRLQTLMTDLAQVERDLDTYISGAVDDVNSTCRRIAELNHQIAADEATGKTANDLRDERMAQINHLSELIGINWFETGDGSITVQAGTGKTLVQSDYPRDTDPDPLYFGDVDGYTEHQLVWRNLNVVMDADEVTSGQIGAWLQVRGGTLPTGSTETDTGDIPQMQAFLNDLASTIIVEVNKLHSQGAGLDRLTDVTGTYESPNATTAFNDSSNTLPFASIVEDGQFEIWAYENGTRRGYTIDVYANDTLTTLMNRINNTINPTMNPASNPVATIEDNKYLRINSSGGIDFAFARDTSNVLAALGINTFFQGSTATNISLNDTIQDNVRNIAAGCLLSDGEHSSGDNTNALDLADLKDANAMTGGTETFNESVISWAADLGTQISAANDSLSFDETALAELQTMRDNVSAVNLDEEMIKMIRFQRSYQMAAKMINVADTLLATLLETKR